MTAWITPAFADGACTAACDGLRLNEVQFVGTGESYKQRPAGEILSLVRMGDSADAEKLDYAQPPLATQLGAGVRSLEFDVAYDPNGGLFHNPTGASMAGQLLDASYVAAMKVPGFKVIHVLDIDFKSSCLTLKECLGQVADWLHTRRNRVPIIIALHPNDLRTPMPGATRPLPFDAAAMDALDADIRAVFPADAIITPDMVQGNAPSLREAVLAHNWPKLSATRGKVMFLLDTDDAHARLYQGARANLEGRAMFVTADEASPVASIICIDDPRKAAEQERIAADVNAGFIVRTRADENAVEARANDPARRAAAFASGAQIVITDFPLPDPKIGPYEVSLSDDPRYTDKSNSFVPLVQTMHTATAH